MPKPKKRSETVATAIRLPADLHEWLCKQPGGLTDTIKRGFEMLRFAEGADEPTLELALAVFGFAQEIEFETGASWHQSGVAHRAFRRALITAIAKWRPADYNDNLFEDVQLAPLEQRPNASHPEKTADEMGITVAHVVLGTPDPGSRERLRNAMRESLHEILRLHEKKGQERND
jgi:hypothetical protein